MKRFIFRILLLALAMANLSQRATAWSEHPLLAHPVLSSIQQLVNENPIMVKSLKTFLMEQEKELEIFFHEQEIWLTKNLSYYPALPEHLRFKATGNPDDILDRFFRALRLNPNVKMRLYQHLLPNEQVGDRTRIDPKLLTTLNDVSALQHTNYVELFENDLVSPMAVLDRKSVV